MKLSRILILISAIGLAACGDSETSNAVPDNTSTVAKSDGCTIKFGWESRKPYQFLENKKMRGIDVEIINQAASQANCQIEYVQDSWVNLLAKVEKGEVDLLAGATPTDERKVYADFSEPYRAESFTLFVLRDNGFTGDNLQAFLSRSNKVGVVNGYFYGDEIDALIDHEQYSDLFKAAESTEKNFNRIQNRRIAGLLTDPVEGRYFIKRKGLASKISETAVNVPSEQVSFMFSKKSTLSEIPQIESAIKNMAASQQIDKIIGNYQ